MLNFVAATATKLYLAGGSLLSKDSVLLSPKPPKYTHHEIVRGTNSSMPLRQRPSESPKSSFVSSQRSAVIGKWQRNPLCFHQWTFNADHG